MAAKMALAHWPSAGSFAGQDTMTTPTSTETSRDSWSRQPGGSKNPNGPLQCPPLVAWVRWQGGDPTGTGKGGQSIYGGYFEDTTCGLDLLEDWGIQEDSEIWKSPSGSTVVLEFTRKNIVCSVRSPDPQNSGAWTRGRTFQLEDEFVSTLKHERRGVALVWFFVYIPTTAL